MRCDLHLHSKHSLTGLSLFGRPVRESHSDPRAAYGEARRRGMDLFTLTDHDTIDGILEVRHLPGTFVGEEVTCVLPGGREVHLGVFGIGEAQHARIRALRSDAEALFAYLAEQRIPCCANHLFSALTGQRRVEDLLLVMRHRPLLETRNGTMPEPTNELARQAGREAGLAPVGGSDAHTLATTARAFTVVPGARSVEEFLDGLRRGLTIARGRSGTYARLTADVGRIVGGAYREAARHAVHGARPALAFALLLAGLPLLPALPLVTAVVAARERLFGARLFRQLGEDGQRLVARRAGEATLGARLAAGGAR